MDKPILSAGFDAPVSRLDVVRDFCRGKDVLDIGCVQHNADNADTVAWLHQVILEVAASVVGVDYLEEDVALLRRRGYNILVGDVTRPLAIDRQMDVIVVGNLIEHLSNFEGLFDNITRLLKKDGRVLVSTANPFYREQYFYSAFKNDILVNPEHTCWIDPVTLDQLARRFGLVTERVFWVKEKWDLSEMILNGRRHRYDMFTGRWEALAAPSRIESVFSAVLEWSFRAFSPRKLSARILQKHGKEGTRRLLFLRTVGVLFRVYWVLYRSIIVTSPINRHELFVSVLRR